MILHHTFLILGTPLLVDSLVFFAALLVQTSVPPLPFLNYLKMLEKNLKQVPSSTNVLYSCSAPSFGAMITMLNTTRESAGNKSLGFLNPFLYSLGENAFTDIADGGSTGCGEGGIYSIDYASWNATVR